MPAAALPIALLLGALADLVGGLVGRLTRRERRWLAGVAGTWADLRRLASGREERADAVEAGGGLAALVGSGVAAAAALGLAPGSVALVYLALGMAAAGVHAAVSVADGARTARARLEAALAEPAFITALGAAFLRWRASDLDAVRGTQTVLGPGITLGPETVTAGLVVAAAVLLVAGAIRLVPEATRGSAGEARPGGASVVVRLARWSLLGATALVVAALVAGPDPGADGARAILALAACVSAVALGLVEGMLRLLPRGRLRLAAGPVALVLAAGAAFLVVLR